MLPLERDASRSFRHRHKTLAEPGAERQNDSNLSLPLSSPSILRTQDGSAAFGLGSSDSNPTPSPSAGTGTISDVLRGDAFGWKFTSAGEHASFFSGNPSEADATAGEKTAGAAVKGVLDSSAVGGLSSSLFDAAPDSALFLANGVREAGGAEAAAGSLSAPARGAVAFLCAKGWVCACALKVCVRVFYLCSINCVAWVRASVGARMRPRGCACACLFPPAVSRCLCRGVSWC